VWYWRALGGAEVHSVVLESTGEHLVVQRSIVWYWRALGGAEVHSAVLESTWWCRGP
jgi:hypothetical protein